jgi:hypothetical protein
MPYRSKAQRRLFHAKLRSGELSRTTVDEWERATPHHKSLPERLHPKKRRRIKTAEPPPPKGVSLDQWDKILQGIKKPKKKGRDATAFIRSKVASTIIGPSNIAGQGLIATRGFNEGDIIAPVVDRVPEGQGDMRSDLLQTAQGRYLNHSYEPNSRNTPLSELQYGIRATRNIAPGEEITTDYREAQATYPGALILTPEEELAQTKQAAYHLGVKRALYHVNLTRRLS